MSLNPEGVEGDNAQRLLYVHLDEYGGLCAFGPFTSVEEAFAWACDHFGFVDSADGWITPLADPTSVPSIWEEQG